MVKRVLSFLLVICLMAGLLVSTLPAAHAASSGSCGENAKWSFDAEKGLLTISGTGAMANYSSYEETPWYAFRNQVITVKVEKGITEVGINAFSWCKNLRTATFADSVTVLHSSAFRTCAALRSVSLGHGLTTIEYGAFHDCPELTNLVIPATVTFMEWPFEACTNLSKIWFLGDAPQNSKFQLYYGIETLGTTVYYPAGNSTWTPDIMKPSLIPEGHDIYWKPYTPLPFTDVEQDDYFFEPVLWAYNETITAGTSDTNFTPNGACTRAQVVTFLWRSAGCPTPATTENPFTDVPEGKFYYDAVLWAVEQGITAGATDTTFNPDGICNRAQVVTFLHRAAGEPAAESKDNPFADVAEDKYYYNAVLWAVEEGITSGISSTKFNPNGNCTRGQIVTFLYRNACPRINEPFEW